MEKLLAKSTWKYAHVSVMPVIIRSHRHWSFRTVATIALFFLMQLSLTACKLWTIRPIESKEQKPAARSQQFNADAYVDSIWESKLVPLVIEKAVDLSTLLSAFDADLEAARKQYGHDEASGAAHFIVKGEGRVSRVNSSSQNGAIVITLPNYKGKTEVVMQVGPVFRGTAIRDAVGFIEFNQFVNQLQFADVGNKLNDRVFTSVVNGFDLATAQGRQVSFYGVFTFSERGKIIITPVKLTPGGKS
jgi:predicted lipoprotein